MRAKAIQFVISALFVSLVFGEEDLDRVFRLTHSETAKDLQEIATVVRYISDIGQPSVDIGQRTVTVRGKAGQVALAEWLFYDLDKATNPEVLAQPNPSPAPHEYRLSNSDSDDDVVRVFYLTQTKTAQDIQEVATLVRSMGDIRRLLIYNAPRAMVLRGTAAQMALTEWLLHEVDSPSPNSAARQYQLSGAGDDVARVFFLRYPKGPQELQEVATIVRSIGEIRRLFTYNAPKAMAARGTADQMALSEWLINVLGTPPQNSTANEYRLAGTSDEVVRVFYVTHADTPQRLQEIATEVRSTAKVRWLFTYNAPRALALRGTASQMALADRLIKERDK